MKHKHNPNLPLRETLKQAGYTHIRTVEPGLHLLADEDGKHELWAARKDHASYGLIYGNTCLEFVGSPVATNAAGLPAGKR